MPQSEQVLNVFVASRNTGAVFTRVFGSDRRWTAAVGVFFDSFGTRGGGVGR